MEVKYFLICSVFVCREWPWILKPAEKFRRIVRDLTFGDAWWQKRIEDLHYARQAKMEVLLAKI